MLTDLRHVERSLAHDKEVIHPAPRTGVFSPPRSVDVGWNQHHASPNAMALKGHLLGVHAMVALLFDLEPSSVLGLAAGALAVL